MPSLDDIGLWLSNPENLIPKVLLPLFLAAVFLLTVQSRSLVARLGRFAFHWAKRVRNPLDEQLDLYRRRLDAVTFKVQHAWMKEEQTLADILVPVVVESEGLA